MVRGKKWVVGAALLSSMLVFLSACGGSGGSKSAADNGSQTPAIASSNGDSGSADPAKQPEVTLTVFSTLANYGQRQELRGRHAAAEI